MRTEEIKDSEGAQLGFSQGGDGYKNINLKNSHQLTGELYSVFFII